MNERIESLMYLAGLTAQGCWDELGAYEREAIKKFAESIVQECASIALKSGSVSNKRKWQLQRQIGFITRFKNISELKNEKILASLG